MFPLYYLLSYPAVTIYKPRSLSFYLMYTGIERLLCDLLYEISSNYLCALCITLKIAVESRLIYYQCNASIFVVNNHYKNALTGA
jgi:hypothetical protein